MEKQKPGLDGKLEQAEGSTDKEDGTLLAKENGESLEQAGEDVTRSYPAREKWSRKLDFMLSCVGFAVGLGNVWRFPYLCYKNGGGAFLIPYFICLVGAGVPIFFLEISLGQFTSEGGVGAWKLCPAFQGIGVASAVIVFLMNIYYIIILAWDLYYMAMAFSNPLPWSHCENPWNTERCAVYLNCSSINMSESILCQNPGNVTPVDPVVEFWERKILQISDGVDEPGGIVWQLAVSLLICWIFCYFCVWKGVKWTGKVVYFTATFPYIVLTILLVRGVTLDGAMDGLEFYLKPDFSRLQDVQVWIDGGTQIFFSYAIALGIITALGSYNKFNNNCYKDCIIISCINTFTSLYAGIVVFSVLGFMAKEQGVSIHDVAESGPGLAFIAYPKAVTQMPMAPFWAVLFFFMIILIGVDSQFVGVEGFVTVIADLFPALRKGWNKEIFIAIYCMISYLLGLTMVTKGGMYVFQLFDYYAASGMSLLWVCLFECITIAWVYGGAKFYDNIESMIGYRINLWFRICWTVITPIVTSGILLFMFVEFKPLTYNNKYEYPMWAQGIGMAMAFSSMMCIPGFFVLKLLFTPGTTLAQRLKKIVASKLHPQLEQKKTWFTENEVTLNNCDIKISWLDGENLPKSETNGAATSPV